MQLVLGRDAGTIVGNAEDYFGITWPGRQADLSTRFRKLERVADEIPDDLKQPSLIGMHETLALRWLGAQVDTAFRCGRAERLFSLTHDFAGVNVGQVE
jgi:hypothetical protein